jgi:hypothetical protein
MSKTQRISLCLVLAFLVSCGTLTASARHNTKSPVTLNLDGQAADWCCAAGLSCCIIPPARSVN